MNSVQELSEASHHSSLSELEQLFRVVIDRLGFVPRPFDTDVLRQVPYWNLLVESAERKGGFKRLIQNIASSEYFVSEKVPLPSLEQKLGGATTAQRGKVLELSEPGTRKTISALSALVPIHQLISHIAPEQKKVKTLVTCPGYIIPIWLRECERFFVNPEIAVITRENRERALKRASLPETDIVIVGYDMTYREVAFGDDAQDNMDDIVRVFCTYPTPSSAYERLHHIIGSVRVDKLREKNTPLPILHKILLREERKSESIAVFDALKKNVFPEHMFYYAIVDEFHNIVGPDAKRSQAIAALVKPARWATLISGTGIGNTLEGLAWAAYVTDFVEKPEDFRKFINGKDSARKVRAFIDLTALYPIRSLADVDSEVKKPLVRTYEYTITETEIELLSVLLEAEVFDGNEKYRLLRYLVANPSKLLPDNFSHLSEGDDPLQERMQQFFDGNPGLEEKVRNVRKSRMEFTRTLVEQVKQQGKKCLVVCEYQRDTTTTLESLLLDLGVRRIDQTVSAEVREMRIKTWQNEVLKGEEFLRGDETYLSDLSLSARKFLKIYSYEMYGMSDREIALHEFATHPGITALVTTRALREGMEATEAEVVINFEETTIPHKHKQLISRTVRSGQRKQVEIWNVRSPLLQLIENYLESKRLKKERVIAEVHAHPGEVSDEDMHSWIDGSDQKRIIEALQNIRVRDILAAHFNLYEGAGSIKYSAALAHSNNAYFISSLYNRRWSETYAGNVARLTRDILLGIEKRYCTRLEHILDAGAGPLAVAQTLKRPTIAIDLNPFQLHHGIDACQDAQIPSSKCYLGDISNLERLVPLDPRNSFVFNPETPYSDSTRLENNSQDVIVSSLVLYYLDQIGRDRFLREAHRVLKEGKYLVLTFTPTKIDDSCKQSFSEEIKHYGFSPVSYFTGTYQGKITVEGSERGERVESYVIVAQRQNINLPEQPLSLRLRPETKVVEHVFREKSNEQKPRVTSPIRAEYFVKLESGLNLQNVDVEREDYDVLLRSVMEKSKPEDLALALASIKRALGGNYETS